MGRLRSKLVHVNLIVAHSSAAWSEYQGNIHASIVHELTPIEANTLLHFNVLFVAFVFDRKLVGLLTTKPTNSLMKNLILAIKKQVQIDGG